MHIEVHYADQAKEYAVPNNCNVLIREDKHHEYKTLVLQTNKWDIKKVLLIQESFKRTLSFILDRAFIESEPNITSQMKQLFSECPIHIQGLVRLDLSEQQDDDEYPEETDNPYALPYLNQCLLQTIDQSQCHGATQLIKLAVRQTTNHECLFAQASNLI